MIFIAYSLLNFGIVIYLLQDCDMLLTAPEKASRWTFRKYDQYLIDTDVLSPKPTHKDVFIAKFTDANIKNLMTGVLDRLKVYRLYMVC